MKATEFVNIVNANLEKARIFFNDKDYADLYNSLKRLEELEKYEEALKEAISKKLRPPQPKYRLTRSLNELSVFKKGVALSLDEDGYFRANLSGEVSVLLAHKDAIDMSLIEEVKPMEIWVDSVYQDEHKNAWWDVIYYCKPTVIKGTLRHYIQAED